MRDVHSDLHLALTLAELADDISMAAFMSGNFEQSSKPDGTPFTPAEEAVEDAIRRVLARERPEDGILGEERGQIGDTSTCWIIDPIDGTRIFVEGGQEWGTQIALQIADRLTVGVTSAPALGSRWWGAVGEGAWMKDDRLGMRELHVSTRAIQDPLRWSCHPPAGVISPEWRQVADRLQPLGDYVAPNPHAVLMLMEGLIEVALQLKGATWDFAAFAAIVEAAGGQFSYVHSSLEIVGTRSGLFTNGRTHAMALGALTSRDPGG